jgi:hypothetical protein
MMTTTTTTTPELLQALWHNDFEAWKAHAEWRIASDENQRIEEGVIEIV